MQLKVEERLTELEILEEIPTDPVESAEAVGLCYVTDDTPGIQRKRLAKRGSKGSGKKGFIYLDVNGERIRNSEEIRRIESLAIPPAYQNVWICPLPNGHLQATGRDAKGRKQYRYHPLWRSIRDQTKFSRMVAFSQALPEIRRRIEKDLSLSGLPKQKVLATILKLMELTRIRVGNEEYAKTNNSYGLTTLQDDHVNVSGSKIQFSFRGKSGIDHEIEVTDKRRENRETLSRHPWSGTVPIHG